MTHRNRNQLWARVVVDELVRAGVDTVCVAPGSRSTPLVLACAEASGLAVVPHLDERSAAFFALGRGRATGRPTGVITTSGTAVANLFPAVVEASQAEVPLLLLTADRPPHLRGADANQAVDQPGIFGSYVREFFEVELPRVEERSLRHLRSQAARAVAAAGGAPAGPVHMNFPFDKPLEPARVRGDVPDDFVAAHPRAVEGRPGGEAYVTLRRRRSGVSADAVEAVVRRVEAASGRGLVVAGPSSEPRRVGRAARRLAAATGFPLLADPLSGARYGGNGDVSGDASGDASGEDAGVGEAHATGGALALASSGGDPTVVGRYDLLLRDPAVREALRPDVVIRIGAAPTSASLCSYLEECAAARQIVVDDGHRFKDHLAVVHDYIRADPANFLDAVSNAIPDAISGAVPGGPGSPSAVEDSFAELWRRMDSRTGVAVERELEGGLFEGQVLRAVIDAASEGDALFVSNSMPVRDLDAFVPEAPRGIEVHGNRGASGIDGVVSTALGLAHGLGRRVTAVVGDLAFHHDMNGLAAARKGFGEVTFVVVNNDGGGIFHLLPVRAFDPPFTELFATPHGLDFRHAAALYDLAYERVSTPGELESALAGDGGDGQDGGSRVVEIRTDREVNRRRHEAVEAAVRRALAEELETLTQETRSRKGRGRKNE